MQISDADSRLWNWGITPIYQRVGTILAPFRDQKFKRKLINSRLKCKNVCTLPNKNSRKIEIDPGFPDHKRFTFCLSRSIRKEYCVQQVNYQPGGKELDRNTPLVPFRAS